ncbi:MAG: MinD/ParA family protein [Sporomusaceae bacterium]|nr:MinD/ParA family protein [Sporomusaceae bacterium]
MHDQAEKLRQLVKTNRLPAKSPLIKKEALAAPRVLTVTSGKGGVGKTNITANLALTLAGKGQRVLLIDADLGMANVDVILGTAARYSLLDLLEDGRRTLDEVITTGPCGIKFLSGGSGIYQLANLSGAQLQRLTSQIAAFDHWADIILIDTGAGIGQNVLNFVIAADEVLLITTPEPTAITDAYALMKAYVGNRGTAPLRLIVNRVFDREEGQGVVDTLNKVAVRFLQQPISELGLIWEDPNVIRAVKKQTPFVLAYPDSAASRSIGEIANRLLYGETGLHSRGIRGFFDKLLKRW